eukprot:g4008.t1
MSSGPRPGDPSSARDRMAQMQWKIRQNAAEMQETLKSLSSWEKDIKKKERSMRKERKRGGGKKKGKLAVPGRQCQRKGSVEGNRKKISADRRA